MAFGLGVLIFMFGLALGVGGAWLVVLGGSWYYLPAGIVLMLSGVGLMRRHAFGAWLFGLFLVSTAIWAAWESGLDYWRWVPRLGLPLALGVAVVLVAPSLKRGPSVRASWSVAGLFVALFFLAFALAFVPYGHTRGMRMPAPTEARPVATDTAPEGFVQPADRPAGRDWPAYGGSNQATRYSPLRQIDRTNVAQLQRAWTYRTGDLPEERWGAETTPLKIGDSVYLCSARNIVISLDANTGRERWRYDPKVNEQSIPYTAACRGVAYYVTPPVVSGAGDEEAATGAGTVDACAARVIVGTLDGRLIAVDASDGRPCADFGRDGEVDIKAGMGEAPPGYVSITSPPTIVRGLVVTGHQVLDGQRRDAPSGVIQGFDARTGALRWAWDMVRPERAGAPPAGESYTRGTPNMWTIAAGDEALGHVYLPMGNSAADYWSGSRTPEEDRYATSLVALDVTTGKPAWHFQTVRIDVWDYDLGSQPTLIDFPVGGTRVPAVIVPSKQGDVYVLDRRSGAPLVGVEERPAPQGGVEPGRRSRTQPFSTYHTLRKRDLTERDMWGITPIDQLACRLQFRRASYQGIYTPPTADRHFIEYPGYNGGSDWGSVAVDPARGVMIANYNDMPNYNILVPRKQADRMGWAPREDVRGEVGGAEGSGDPQIGTPYAIDVNAGWRQPFTKLLCKQPPYGGIRAVDLASGRTIWDRPFGTARGNGPFGIRSGLPIEIGTPNNGGPVVTAGGLIFIAAATDDLIRAIDIETGQSLWQDALPAGGQATPMVYESGGRQFLVIVAAGHHFMETPVGDHVIAYALPDAAPR
jgi:quinoprotein glucose dehydrogenase